MRRNGIIRCFRLKHAFDKLKEVIYNIETVEAARTDGDIVGVCKKPGDSKKGSDLLKIAVANDGKKLDAFSKLLITD